MIHLWLRAEQRKNENRTGLTPVGAHALLREGFKVSVEESSDRVFTTESYHAMGCEIVPQNSWSDAPGDAIILGLKELPDDGRDLTHRHIMFGHAYKGQAAGPDLLKRFKSGGGTLLDLEYLTNDAGRRLAAFGYWAGYTGAAISMLAWAAQQSAQICPEVSQYKSREDLIDALKTQLATCGPRKPRAIVIGAKGRVGTGGTDLLEALGCGVTKWDMAETAVGGPFAEILDHDIFLNCVLATPNTPAFVTAETLKSERKLSVIGDIACDPDSPFNPIPLYHRATDWQTPVTRVRDTPALDIMAIDNLPSLLPKESSEDFAAQLLPLLLCLKDDNDPVWTRARSIYHHHRDLLEAQSA